MQKVNYNCTGLQTALELTGDRREFNQLAYNTCIGAFSAFVYFVLGLIESETAQIVP